MVDQSEIHRKTVNVEVEKRKDAVSQLDSNFAILPDKKQAWDDLHRLTRDKDWYVRKRAAKALGNVFQQIPNKKQAWADLIRLTQDMDGSVRWDAANTLRIVVPHIPDKREIWDDLHRLTHDKHKGVRLGASYAIHTVVPHIPDKKQAWEDLIRLTQGEDEDIRRGAAYTLHTVFPHILDKEEAWKDLHRLTQDEDRGVRSGAAHTFRIVFLHIPDKKEAWKDLIRLTHDKDESVRLDAAYTLHIAFPHILDKKEACEDLIRLTQDEDRYVRRGAVKVFGLAFPHTFDKKQIWDDLHRLTRDEDRYVRVSARHSLGRLSIFKATKTKDEENFKKELENALKFFEASSREANYSSRFCFLFYRSFYTIAFEKQTTEDQVQKYLAEAKKCVGGSKNKETLLEAVEKLANALTEAHEITDFDTISFRLDAYRQYCERVADLIGSAEEGAPGAARVLRKGLLIIDDQIKEIIREVQEKTETFCRQTKDTQFKDLGEEIYRIGKSFSQTKNPVELEKRFDNLQFALSDICDKMPDEVREGACELLKRANEEPCIEDALVWISMFLSKIPHCIEQGKKITPPFLSDLESEICDIFKSVYQKERKEDASEVNSKTMEFLKYKLLDLTASGKRIDWLDVGCGDGRCLDVLNAVQNRGNIRYHGTDSSYRYLDDTEERARNYGLDARLDKIDAAAMKFDSEYDVVSAVLLLHEVDPLCLPYILRNMLRALKSDGTLIIADFQGPYEQEEGVVAWGAEDIKNLLEKIGGAKMSIEFIPSSQYPDELGFYRCYVKKPGLDREKFSDLLHGYDNFLDAKKEESKQRRGELRSQIEERVRKLLNRPDINLKNISEGEMQRIRTEIGDEYGIKAHKIRLLTSQIEFLDDKIKEFRSGVGCDGADQHAL